MMVTKLQNLLVFCFWIMPILALPMWAEDSKCSTLGRSDPAANSVAFQDFLQSQELYAETLITLEAKLILKFESDGLVDPNWNGREEHSGLRLYPSFEWKSLGSSKKEVLRILKQWNHGTVRAEGLLRIYDDIDPELPELVGSLNNIGWIEILDLEPRPSYRLDYSGPIAASVREIELSEVPGLLRPCEPERVSWEPLRWSACLDAIEPFVTVRGFGPDSDPANAPRRVDLTPLPEPFDVRDIVDFEAINQSTFVYTMFDGRLYASPRKSSAPVDEVEEGGIDMLGRGRNWVYYRVTRFHLKNDPVTLKRSPSWNALRRVNARFVTETLWESSQQRLTRIIPPSRERPWLSIEVEQEGLSKVWSWDSELAKWVSGTDRP